MNLTKWGKRERGGRHVRRWRHRPRIATAAVACLMLSYLAHVAIAQAGDSVAGIWTWGGEDDPDMSWGQLGAPTLVAGLASARSLAYGTQGFAVAADAQGKVWTAGDDSAGSLGDGGGDTSRAMFAQVPGLSRVTEVIAGNYLAAALRSDGTVWSWGYAGADHLRQVPVPTPVEGLTGVTAISGPGDQLLDAGSLAAQDEAAANGATAANTSTAEDGVATARAVGSQGGVHAASAGSADHRSASAITGAAKRGPDAASMGAVKGGPDAPSTSAVKGGLATARAGGAKGGAASVNAGGAKGGMATANTSGAKDRAATADTGGVKDRAVTANTGGAKDGAVEGDATAGSGTESGGKMSRKSEIGGLSGFEGGAAGNAPSFGGNVAGFESEAGANLAVRTGGTVWTWRRPASGAATIGDWDIHRVAGLSRISTVAAADDHRVALGSDGRVWVWGDNSHGQYGNGTTSTDDTVHAVPGLTRVTAVAAGRFFTLARRSDGTVWAWGADDAGQLGDGSRRDEHTPHRITELTGIAAINAGRDDGIALGADGRVQVWGRDGYHGSTTSAPAPVTEIAHATVVGSGNAVLLAGTGTPAEEPAAPAKPTSALYFDRQN